MTKPDWQNENDYAYTANLDEVGWAWEFLRRNEDYKDDWEAFRMQSAKYEKEFGTNWKKHRSTWRYDPPLLENETPDEWSTRCILSVADFEELPYESYCAKKWGLALHMPDPNIRYDELKGQVQFLNPLKFPRIVGDEIEFNVLTTHDGNLPYSAVAARYKVIAFDLSLSIDSQIKEAKIKLMSAAKYAKSKRNHRVQKAWRRYLQALDAKSQNVPYKDIGLCLTNAENDDYPDRLASNSANQLIKSAKNVMAKYHQLVIPMSSNKTN